MNPISRKPLASLLGFLMLALATGGAWAQTTPPTDSSHDTMGAMHSGHGDMSGMQGMKDMHKNMMGMHTMPATVTSVDKQTGMVEANAEGMPLKLHFPKPAVANLNTGDKITLHLGYSKP